MKSMTGYGRAELLLPDYSGVIEVSSVNKRGFEFLLHGPKEWQFFEKKALSIVRTFAERGRIRLAILLNPPSIQHTDHLTDQLSKIQEQLDVIQNICKQSKVPYSPSTCLLYTSPSPRDLSTSRMPSSP